MPSIDSTAGRDQAARASAGTPDSPSRAVAAAPYHRCIDKFLAGTDTPRAYIERCIENIDNSESVIRAFVHLDLDSARRQADQSTERYRQGRPLSPVDGMPVGVKDIIDTRDMPTQMNSPIFSGFQPRRDAACVVALKQAGAVVVGKTVTTEFACGRSGPTRNPHDTGRTPGGSSSGSAAAVAAGMLPAGLGTQTQASIIRPASYCGVIGYKPTMDMLCIDGVGRLAPTLDHLGVLAGDLGDARALAAAIAAIGPDYAGPVIDLTVGVGAKNAPRRLVRLDTQGWAELDDASRRSFDQTIAGLAAAGVDIIDRSDARIAQLEARLADACEQAYRIFAWEAQWPLRSYARCGADLIGARVQELVDTAGHMTRQDYDDAVRWRAALRDQVAALTGEVDGFVCPSASGPAPPGLDETGSRTFPVPWTLVGGPSLSLPVQRVAGMPFGLQLMGFYGRDSDLFSFAGWLMAQHEHGGMQ